MSRVNMEDSLIMGGHVRCVAKIMQINEREAWGSIGLVYRSTRQALASTASIMEMAELIRLDFDDKEHAMRMLHAMVSAQLATLDGDQLTIRGNEKHVQRFVSWKASAVKGGFASVAARRKKAKEIATEGSTVGFDSVNQGVLFGLTEGFDLGNGSAKPRVQRAKKQPVTHPVITEHRRLLLELHSIDLHTLPTDRYELVCAKFLQKSCGETWPQVLAFYVGTNDDWFKREGWPLSLAKNNLSKITARWKMKTSGGGKSTAQVQNESAEYEAMLERRRIEAECVP